MKLRKNFTNIWKRPVTRQFRGLRGQSMHISNERKTFKNNKLNSSSKRNEENQLEIYLQILHFIFLLFPQWIPLRNPPF